MSKKYKSYKIKMIFMTAAFTLMSLSFVVMAFTDYDRSGIMKVLAYVATCMLYFGFLAGVIFLIILTVSRRKDNGEIKGIPGVIRFFANKAAVVADILFMLSIVAVIVINVKFVTSVVTFTVTGCTMLTFVYHSILNGKNFLYLMTLRKAEKES